MFKRKSRKIHGLGLLVGVAGLVSVSAGAADASHYIFQGGGSSGTGWELGPDVDNFCSQGGVVVATQFETTYYEISHSSATYIVRSGGGSILAQYDGPVATRVDHGDMVAYPTHAEPGECADADGVYGTISLTAATVSGSSGNGSISCAMSSVNGTYQRVNTDAITIIFDVPCTVDGNTVNSTVSNVTIRHTVQGTQTPCFQVLPSGCTNPDAGSQLSGVGFTVSHP